MVRPLGIINRFLQTSPGGTRVTSPQSLPVESLTSDPFTSRAAGAITAAICGKISRQAFSVLSCSAGVASAFAACGLNCSNSTTAAKALSHCICAARTTLGADSSAASLASSVTGAVSVLPDGSASPSPFKRAESFSCSTAFGGTSPLWRPVQVASASLAIRLNAKGCPNNNRGLVVNAASWLSWMRETSSLSDAPMICGCVIGSLGGMNCCASALSAPAIKAVL
mmetsp:Transcript_11058/g.20094  ORF Transcript_11058/g.20094 Transcript_11058/m.20094 type:complete len:225 (-) Transcript_11058:1648-2322(-)